MPRLIVIVFVLTLTACSTEIRSVRLGEEVDPKIIPGKVFVPEKKFIAKVGEVMLVAGEYSKNATGLQLESFRIEKRTTTKVKHKLRTFEFSIPTGNYRLHSRNNGGSYYSAPAGFLSGQNGTRNGYGGLFVPSDSSKATEIYWSWVYNTPNVYQAKLAPPIAGSIEESIVHLQDQESSGPRITLTYAGVFARQIRFVYKEFTEEGFARPAFTQEVILDYKPGSTYAYKDAEFIVEKADSTHITFKLLHPF